MTDEVNPSGTRAADAKLTAGAMRYGGGDWIVPTDKVYYADEASVDLSTPLDAFGGASHSGDSLTVTIGTGEAFVLGAWLGRDVTTDVQLADAVNNQVVYLGWAVGSTNSVIIGTDSAFGADDPRMAIHEYDTDTNGVMAHRDVRALGEQIDVRNEGSTAQADHADNSDNLGGEPASDYLRSDGDDTIHGHLDVQNDDENDAMRIEANGGSTYLAPVINGEALGDHLLKYEPADNHWKASGSNIITRADVPTLDVDIADMARDSQRLGGVQPGNYARSDTADTMRLAREFFNSDGTGWEVNINPSGDQYIAPVQTGTQQTGNALLYENGTTVLEGRSEDSERLGGKAPTGYVQYSDFNSKEDFYAEHAKRSPTYTSLYYLEPDQEVVVLNTYSTNTFYLWAWGVRQRGGGNTSGSSIFLVDEGGGDSVPVNTTSAFTTGSPIWSDGGGGGIRIHLKNTGSSPQRISGAYAISRGH